MAVRWCGDLKIIMKLDEEDREGYLYHCSITCPICHCVPKCDSYKADIRMGNMDRQRLAEDNPESFDLIARSVMAQAWNEDRQITDHSEEERDGSWKISRKASSDTENYDS